MEGRGRPRRELTVEGNAGSSCRRSGWGWVWMLHQNPIPLPASLLKGEGKMKSAAFRIPRYGAHSCPFLDRAWLHLAREQLTF